MRLHCWLLMDEGTLFSFNEFNFHFVCHAYSSIPECLQAHKFRVLLIWGARTNCCLIIDLTYRTPRRNYSQRDMFNKNKVPISVRGISRLAGIKPRNFALLPYKTTHPLCCIQGFDVTSNVAISILWDVPGFVRLFLILTKNRKCTVNS